MKRCIKNTIIFTVVVDNTTEAMEDGGCIVAGPDPDRKSPVGMLTRTPFVRRQVELQYGTIFCHYRHKKIILS